MTHRYLLTIMLLFLSACLSAQSNFRQAVIIKDDNTELRGWIDCREWDMNPNSFHFKPSPESNYVTYTIQEVSSFEIEGLARFERARVSISLDTRTMIQGLATGPDKRTRTETVFLKTIASGKVINLYAYTDDIKTRFYVKDNSNGIFTELIYRKYYTGQGPQRIATDNMFRNQLQLMASKGEDSKSSGLLQQLARAEYDASSLAAVADRINGVKQERKERKNRVYFYAGIGLYASKGIYGRNYAFNDAATTKTSYLPKVSVGADLFNNSYTKRFMYRLDLGFSAANQGISRTEANGKVSSHSYKQYTATLSPQIMYNLYNGQSIRANLGIGFGINLSLYDNDPVTINNSSYSRDEKMNLNPLWLSAVLRAGIIVTNRVDIYGQFIPGSNINQGGSFVNLRSSAWQVGANILFWQ